ncbi:MAG: hypothetical protein KC635_18095, partial [Myxococcales bacterium]|nr:hypothetical protein [Myxococcales bacterium]
FADMNGNGTDDVVWVASNGHVRFLELFPVRPNLLSRVENGIGWVRIVEYGTSIAQRARDAGTADAWAYPLPESMNVVTAMDTWVTLTGGEDGAGVHERRELSYRDGFYDGDEKSFRGFERVERRLVTDADDAQDPGLDVLEYDVGRDDPYHNGLLVRQASLGGAAADVPIRESRTEFGDCPITGVDGAEPPVRFVCQLADVSVVQEGADSSAWVTTRSENTWDGYGNVVRRDVRGVVNLGPPEAPTACGACPSLGAGLSSGPCGAECLGDEQVTTTTYVEPGDDTGGAWLLRLPVRVRTGASESGRMSETMTYYDGPDFVGLAAGKADKGLVTRVTERVSDSEVVATTRQKRDARGSVVAVLDPNGDPAVATAHRRDYEYDERGLRVTRVTIHAGSYDLVQDVSFESSFLKPSESTAYRVVAGGEDKTPRNGSSYAYDEFGRAIAIARPGDTREAPTLEYAYELGDPVTRVVIKERRTPGGPQDVQSVQCQDGRGRAVQTLSRVADGDWRAEGFRVLNAAGQVVRLYQPYRTTSGDCATTAPTGPAFAAYHYDAVGRVVTETAADAAMFGGVASVVRTRRGPLTTTVEDKLDSDAGSPFAGTPTTQVFDGLDRLVRVERTLSGASGVEAFGLAWDELGNLARVEDPAGHVHQQEFDLAGRAVRTVDANSGTTTYDYDAAGLEVRRTDARGVTVVAEYDAVNRRVARYDAADEAGTVEAIVYDLAEGCADCKNGAGFIVRQTYPIPGDQRGSDELGYDARGNQTLLRRTLEGHVFDTTYAYDGDNQVTRATYPDGRTLDYARDGASRVTAVAGVAPTVTYTPEGRIASIGHANGVTESFTYDAVFRLAGNAVDGPGGAAIEDWSVTRDREGNVLSVTDAVPGGAAHPSRSATFAYDAYYRLTEAALDPAGTGPETLTYTYDALDNVTSRASSRGSASPRHAGAIAYGQGGAGPSAVASVGGVSYAYDAGGYTLSRGATQLAWDHLGRLVEAAPATGALTEMGYGPGNDRVIKLEDGGVAYYAAPDFVVRDGIASLYARVLDRRVARLRSDALAASVLPDGNADDRVDIADAWLGRSAAGDTPTRLLRAAARRLLFEAQGDEAHLHLDLRGSVVAATDGAGAVIAARDFYPFGAERAATGWVDELGFSGQELDRSSGLLHFRERYLDPVAGRWSSPDPAFALLDAARVQRRGEAMAAYAYVGNNPVMATDPTGQLIFALFVSPIRKKVFPYRDRKVSAREIAAETRGTRTVGTNPLHEGARGGTNPLYQSGSQGQAPGVGAEPGLARPTQATPHTNEGQDRAGSTSSSSGGGVGIAWLIPDALLIATVAIGGVAAAAAATGYFDDDGGESGGGGDGLTGVFSGGGGGGGSSSGSSGGSSGGSGSGSSQGGGTGIQLDDPSTVTVPPVTINGQ